MVEGTAPRQPFVGGTLGFVENDVLGAAGFESFNQFLGIAFFSTGTNEQQVHLLVKSGSILEDTVESIFNAIVTTYEESAESTHLGKFIYIVENSVTCLEAAS
jgi:hypothetical protein